MKTTLRLEKLQWVKEERHTREKKLFEESECDRLTCLNFMEIVMTKNQNIVTKKGTRIQM